jgi:hypothetical protein
MQFDPAAYGDEVAEVLALDGDGARRMPLLAGKCSHPEAAPRIRAIARAPVAAGLWVYFSAYEEAHQVAQELPSAEGSYWHAIVHRQEPDGWNSQYWFNRVGRHAIFRALAAEAAALASGRPGARWTPPDPWQPARFIECTERARQAAGTELAELALDIQQAEWRLLFDHCARLK